MGIFARIFGTGNVNRGLANYARNEPDLPKSVNESVRWAKEWSKLENYDEEMRCLEHALKLKQYDVKHPEIYTNMGVVRYKQGKVDEALGLFDKALSIHNRYASALFNKGAVLLEIEDWEGALECYDVLLKINANDAQAMYNKSVALDKLGEIKEADELLKKAYRTDKTVREHVNKQYNKIKRQRTGNYK